MFFGREKEFLLLNDLKKKKTASLVCVCGRRRIGKSTLIEKFAEKFSSFVQIQGLGPEKGYSNQNQLDHFASRLSIKFNTKKEHYEDWTDAFHSLFEKVKNKECLILLDEISWMGKKDALFAAKIKDAWDLEFKKNPKLILVLCGSVSSWIEENILKNSNFEGRISLQLDLQELSLPEANQFWINSRHLMGSLEKMMILAVTGGVPKYLEEILSSQTAEKNIVKLCFDPSGIFFNDYDKIFSEVFDRKRKALEKIIKLCFNKKLTPVEIAKELEITQNGELTEHLHILEFSGFISRDYYFKPDGAPSTLSHIRIKDNYLQFYLNYIEPLKLNITKGHKIIRSLFDLKNFEAILGYQFENLILNNRNLVHSLLEIPEQTIMSSAPYVQRKNTQNRGGCQIDLMIHTSLDVFYLCEMKCKRNIDRTIIKELAHKMNVIKLPKRSSLKPILIYEGEINPFHLEEIESFFYKMIPFEHLLLGVPQ